ncbi:MAG: hypothetical protein ABS40_15750 [Agrobacterium sp. SCN 61-19]|nr:MAG: hypothetical protein ABS40_15750 [Agrobacterium sp. SCN 61-19]
MNVPLNTRVRMLREACRLLVNEGLSAIPQPQTEQLFGSVIKICGRLERPVGRMCAIQAQPERPMR